MNKIIKISLVLLFISAISNTFFFSGRSKLINNYKNKNKLIVFGDIGYYNTNLKDLIETSKNFMNKNDKLILMGDNFYNNGVDNIYDELWKTFSYFFDGILQNNIYTIMGNHDYHKNPKSQIKNNFWNTPSFYYKLELDNKVDLFFIDTVQLFPGHCNISKAKIENVYNDCIDNINYNQLKWLNDELSKSKNKKIVFGHYPVISNGVYKYKLQPIYDILFPILKNNNVDAYVSGHEHNVQYLKRKIGDFNFNQFIIGSSAENRINEYKYIFHRDMYDNKDNYIMIIHTKHDKLCIDFVNSKFQSKYKYIF